MSLVVRGLDERSSLLPLVAAVAVVDACESVAGVRCRIKWPNDVWIERRKVAGILVEGRPAEGWAVLGIGLNVATEPEQFPPELGDLATSLRAAAGAAPPVDEVLRAILEALDQRLRDDPSALLDAWRARDALRGERVRWAGGEGVAAGIDDSGSLLVETSGGELALGAGEVHLLR
jgi:BirA family biotin operon repressor/biotin-[acetyl-CoA-carboxylase] ligase